MKKKLNFKLFSLIFSCSPQFLAQHTTQKGDNFQHQSTLTLHHRTQTACTTYTSTAPANLLNLQLGFGDPWLGKGLHLPWRQSLSKAWQVSKLSQQAQPQPKGLRTQSLKKAKRLINCQHQAKRLGKMPGTKCWSCRKRAKGA